MGFALLQPRDVPSELVAAGHEAAAGNREGDDPRRDRRSVRAEPFTDYYPCGDDVTPADRDAET